MTAQLDRSELKEEAPRNTAREEEWVRAKGQALGKHREAGWRDALVRMVVTELTSQLDRSELKEEAQLNTAREEMGEREGTSIRQAKGKLGGGTHCLACW